jgi:hypothetical protein
MEWHAGILNPNEPMKKYLPSVFFAVSVMCLAWAMPAFVTGCSTNSQTTAYKAASATTVTVDAAMTAWGDYVAQYHPPVAQEQAVANAYAKYQAAAVLALDAYQALLSSTSTNAAAGVNNPTVLNANAAVASALADLVTVIQSFGAKL